MQITKFSFLIMGALAVFFTAAPLAAQETRQPRLVTMTGTGEVRAQPDKVIVTTGVVSRAVTAREALTKNSTTMAALLEAVKKAGIEAKDVQTSSFSIQPNYDYPHSATNPTNEPRLTGYEASNQVTLVVRNLANLGTILDALVTAGSNQVGNISFGLDKPEPLKDEARKLAVADATRKAQLYAAAAGVQLGPIYALSESSGANPQPVYQYASLAAKAADSAPVPVAEGEMVVSIYTNIAWAIK